MYIDKVITWVCKVHTVIVTEYSVKVNMGSLQNNANDVIQVRVRIIFNVYHCTKIPVSQEIVNLKNLSMLSSGKY